MCIFANCITLNLNRVREGKKAGRNKRTENRMATDDDTRGAQSKQDMHRRSMPLHTCMYTYMAFRFGQRLFVCDVFVRVVCGDPHRVCVAYPAT